jgi:hypothetical protein
MAHGHERLDASTVGRRRAPVWSAAFDASANAVSQT